MVETDHLDLSRTAGGGSSVVKITSADLRQIVDNFALWAGPVPIHRDPHRDYSETAGPADGFIESLSVRGSELVAHLFLTPSLMAEVAAGQWRGFSVDMLRNPKRPTGEFKGLAVIGGVLTNRPALDVNFRIAASAAAGPHESGSHVMQFSIAADSSPHGGVRMDAPDISVQLATAQAEVKSKDDRITSLTADLDTSRTELTETRTRLSQVETQLATAQASEGQTRAALEIESRRVKEQETHANALQTQLSTEREEHSKLKGEVLGTKVLKLCIEGVRRGAPGSFFGPDGIDTVKKDPVGWYAGRFSSLKALEDFVAALPKTASLSGVKSGTAPDDDNEPVLDKDRVDSLTRLSLNPRYATVANVAELAAAKEAAAKK